MCLTTFNTKGRGREWWRVMEMGGCGGEREWWRVMEGERREGRGTMKGGGSGGE